MYYSLLTNQELDFLLNTAKAELNAGDTYVEIGSFALGTIGRIASALPNVNCQAVDVLQHDWLDFEESPTRDYLKARFPQQEWSSIGVDKLIKDIERRTPNLTLTVGYSRSVVFHNAGLQFIDADHNYAQVMADFWHCWAQAREGSLVIGHDLQIPGTKKAVVSISRTLNTVPWEPEGNLWAFRKAGQ